MRNRIAVTWTLACCGLLLAGGTNVLSAAEASFDLSDAIKAATAAKSEFAPISAEKFAAARANLDSATADLQRWLGKSGDRKTTGWKKYLKWDLLQTQLAEGEQASIKELESVLAQFSGAEIEGLELSYFTKVRSALRQYIDSLYVKATPDVEKHYTAQLDALIKILEAYQNKPGTDLAAGIGGRLDYLERTGQATQLVEQLRGKFGQPNLQVRASEEFLIAGLERDVDDTAPIRDVILGTRVYGTGRTTGRVTGRLVPDEESATIEIQLTAVNHSNNVGYNGPVTVRSRGVTYINAQKQVQLDALGLHQQPASASCTTDSSIYSISARCKLIERAARRRASQQSGQVEWVAARHAEQRVASRFGEEVRSALAEAEEKYEDRFRKPLVRKNEFPQRFELTTTEEALFLKAQQANGSQLAAPTAAPEFADDIDLAVRLHESMAGNMSEAILGGMELTDERLAEILEKQTGEVPEELQISQDKEPWSITFAARQPVAVVFGDDTVRIAVRGSQFTRGDTALDEPLEISATYTLERTPSGSKLTRQGEVDVLFLRSRGQLGIRQVTFKTFMRRKFEALFKEEFVGEGLELPGQLKSRGKLKLAQLDSSNGWLALGWNLPPETVGAE